MELAQALTALWRHRVALALVVVTAVGAAAAAKLTATSKPKGAATSQLLVDSPMSAIADLRQATAPLVIRASVFAQFLASAPIIDKVAQSVGVRPDQIAAAGPFGGSGVSTAGSSAGASSATGVTTAAAGAVASAGTGTPAVAPPYQLNFVAQDQLPLITISAQAPTVRAAARLADAVYPAVTGYLAGIQSGGNPQRGAAQSQSVPPLRRVTVRQLGQAQAARLRPSSTTILAAGVGAALLLLGISGILILDAVRRRGRAPVKGESRGADAARVADLPMSLPYRASVVGATAADRIAETSSATAPGALAPARDLR